MEAKYGISVLFEGGGSVTFGGTRLPDSGETIDQWIDEQVETAISEDHDTGLVFVAGNRVDCILYQKAPEEEPEPEPKKRNGLLVPRG